MRKALKSEQEKFEIEAAERVDRRLDGFSLMSVRDKGWSRMSNGTVIEWHVSRPLGNYENKRSIPDNHIGLVTPKGEHLLFDAEEFRKWLRWA